MSPFYFLTVKHDKLLLHSKFYLVEKLFFIFFRLSNSPHGPSAKFLVQNSKLTQFKFFFFFNEKIENLLG